MSLLSLLFGEKPKSATVAKERLQLIIARERSDTSAAADYLPALQKDLVQVISKYVKINPDDIRVSLEKQDHYEVLEVNIVLPEPQR
ncbi:MAG: cell division topological specificity factor MinE [Proteobacteria bacterium]|nr:cell division topological specificity factor MinE [Pseudomonadota bacterium]HQR04181.1 cell division topological specificity factor MinE [Rhodocyclaceae bacterium]